MKPNNYEVLFRGLDTLHVIYYGDFNFFWWEASRLKEMKRLAQGNRGISLVKIGDQHWEVSPRGTREYVYCLLRNGWRLYLMSTRGMKPKYIQMKIEIPSSRLRLGLEGLKEEVSFLTEIILSNKTEGIQRVDITADISRFSMDQLNDYHFYGYPSKMSSINSDLLLEKFYALGNKSNSETVVVGKNPQLRIYDKKKLSIAQDPDWFQCWYGLSFDEVLSLHGGDANEIPPITRFEFQLRTQILREFQVFSYEELIEKVQGLWDYMATQWLELKLDDPEKKNKRKLPVAPIWEFIRKVKFNGNMQLKRTRPFSHDSSKNFNQFLGHFSSFLAKEGILINWENEEAFKEKVLQVIKVMILDSEKVDWENFLAKFHKKYNQFQGI